MIKTIYKILLHVLALAGLLCIGLYAYLLFVESEIQSVAFEFSNDDLSIESQRFSEHIYFDYSVSNPSLKLPSPPEGEATLYGTIVYDGQPVSGVVLDIFLNGEFKKEGLVSDARGRYSLSVKPGDWVVNMIAIKKWEGKPKGDFKVLSGLEPKQSAKSIHTYNDYSPVQTRAEVGGEYKLVELMIAEKISIASPKKSKLNKFSIEDEISWNPHLGASNYRVVINSVNKEGSSTIYSDHSQLIVSSESVPLSMFDYVNDDGEPSTYAVEVFAYDDQGSLISQSDGFYDHSFLLSDYRLVREDMVGDIPDIDSAEELQLYYKNSKRIDAVELLLDERLMSEAESLLKKVDETNANGKKSALTGYVLALKGNCEEAITWFNKAKQEGGKNCVPTKYYAECAVQ